MTQRDDRLSRSIATLNTDAVGFGNGNRRIDRLRQLANDCQLFDDDARQFGKLTKTSTWESLLNSHGLEFEPKTEITSNTVETASQDSQHSIDFFEWVNFGQLLAVGLASVGLAVMVLSLYPKINPLNLLPVKITIQVGK